MLDIKTAQTNRANTDPSSEREHLGCDHAQVGSWLIQSWGLPAPLHTTVLASHMESPVNAGEPLLARIVAASGSVADIWLTNARSRRRRQTLNCRNHLKRTRHAYVREALDARADGFIVKPFTTEKILAEIERAFARRSKHS